MAKKRITTASAKAKGRRLQQWVAKEISKLLKIPLEKDGDIESRPMGQAGSDVIMRGNARKRFFFDGIECKNQERVQIWQALEQAETNGKKPLLFFKRNRSDTYVVMKAKDFFALYRKILRRK